MLIMRHLCSCHKHERATQTQPNYANVADKVGELCHIGAVSILYIIYLFLYRGPLPNARHFRPNLNANPNPQLQSQP